MDTTGGFEDRNTLIEGVDAVAETASDIGADTETDGGVDDRMFDLGGDERRMHVRAYNHWVSLLHGKPFPGIADLDPASIADFGPHSVLIDFQHGIEDPRIAYLGSTLREECGLASGVTRVAEVPNRSLLSRLTDHYLQIIANRAPIGFEAEFVGTRGHNTLYRGILMPFSSNGDSIDFIYGVINWKEVVDAATQATLAAELEAAVRATPARSVEAPIWADGPSGFDAGLEGSEDAVPTGSLGDRLALARESAAQVRASDTRSRAALYRALGRAHDFAIAADADPDGYAALLDNALIAVRPRAPMTPVVKLVFGADYDKTRLAEYAGVLSHARRHAIGERGLPAFIDGHPGGIKAVVAAERTARRPAKAPDIYERAAAELRALPALATVPIGAGDDEFIVLIARAGSGGTIEVVRRVESKALTQQVVRRAAA